MEPSLLILLMGLWLRSHIDARLGSPVKAVKLAGATKIYQLAGESLCQRMTALKRRSDVSYTPRVGIDMLLSKLDEKHYSGGYSLRHVGDHVVHN